MADSNEGISISPKVLVLAGAGEIEIELDIYAPDEPDDETLGQP